VVLKEMEQRKHDKGGPKKPATLEK